tara:strand:+ start:2825 stop:5236 length:2412 start_codon:yes stop_codon:yes gene_type:complete
MKNNNNFLKIFIFIFSIFFSNFVLSEEFNFSASKIETFNEGNLIKGFGGVQINDGPDLIITGNELEFDKIKSTLKVMQNALVRDEINKNIIRSSKIIFDKKLNVVISKDKTIIELGDSHIIESSNVVLDRNLNTLFSDKQTLITDLTNNNSKISMDNFNFSVTKKILTANNVKINDNEGNIFTVEKIKYNIKKNEILGKDFNMSFSNKNLNSKENEPRLKGNALFYTNNITKIDKGVFTTCKKNDNCPPWVLQSEKIEHDKVKKRINYNNALLKIYDIPVLYFPKFFHPDPTVKRQSGFLMPQFSQSNNLGSYLVTPYFNAISESSDLTFSPRLYGNGNALYQAEYRKHKKNSEHIVDVSILNKDSLLSNSSSSSHLFLDSRYNLDVYNFDQSKLKLKIQKTTDDNYLQTHKLISPLIDSKNLLHSSLNFDASRDGLEVAIKTEVYENLNLPQADRFEYVFPSFSVIKDISQFDNGSLTLESSGDNKLFNTNINERSLVNDLKYKSYNKISTFGIVSNYEVLLKNFNVKSKNSTKYKDNGENTLQSIINYEIKYPLQKINKKFLRTLTPKISARFSPNQSKNKSLVDRNVDLNNIFSTNRIGFSDTVEGGQSITIGGEYNLYNNNNLNKEVISINLASVLRDVENNKLPINTTIGKKYSDILGNIYFNANNFLDFDYNFSLDNDLETLNFNQIKSTVTLNNFVSEFDFLERNNLLNKENYISNKTKVRINQSSSFGFSTRRNREKNLTEYYNLLYEYQNDCLVAGIEYRKDFYNSGLIEPEEQLFFSVTIMPFGKANTPSFKP